MRLLDRLAPAILMAGLIGFQDPIGPIKISKSADDIDAVDFAVIAEDAELIDAISVAYRAGAADTAGLLGVDLLAPSQPALAFARARAAEMIGMRRLEDGRLVENPNAQWVISDTIRQDAKGLINTALEEGWSYSRLSAELHGIFSESRAEMIARTELGFAYNGAAADIYQENGVGFVEPLDGDGCLPDGHDDSAPDPTGEIGVVELEAQVNGQIWTLDQMRSYPLGHPHCVRVFIDYDGPTPAEETT